MKFLVLALCVCAASAASFGNYGASYKPSKRYNSVYSAQAVAQVAPVAPFVPKAVSDPVPIVPVAPVVPIAAAVKTYQSQAKSEAESEVLRADSEVNPDGYRYAYETANGISAEASGSLKNVENSAVLVSQGGYRYVAPDGTPVEITYIADENGYQPQGALLPVAPPVPEAILRSLAYIASHPQPVEYANKF